MQYYWDDNPAKARKALCALILALYLAFLGLDIFAPGYGALSAALKYAGVLLCFAAAASGFRSADKRDFRLLIVALLFTLVSDAFLLFTQYHIAGVSCFCCAHVTYIRRYAKAAFKPAALLAASVAVAALVCALLNAPIPYLYVISALYAALIACATVCAFYAKHPRAKLIRAGMLLFVLCDSNVAIFNALPRSHPAFHAASLLMWVFYLPSQLLLALSCAKKAPDQTYTKLRPKQ